MSLKYEPASEPYTLNPERFTGCIVDSCRECANCQEGAESYCSKGMTGTYNVLTNWFGPLIHSPLINIYPRCSDASCQPINLTP